MKNNKIKFFLVFFLILVFSINLFGCFENKIMNIINEDLNGVIAKIEMLEYLSRQYDENDYIKRTTIYIRCKKYDSLQWTILDGKLKGDFETYIQENQEDINLQDLQYTSFIIDPATENQIDFLHMFATMNLVLVSQQVGDLGGWGGDLCQLVQEVSNQNLPDEELENLIVSKFNHDSSFNCHDLLADIDAVNLIKQIESNPQKSIAKEMKIYYENLTQTKRIKEFNKYLFKDSINSGLEQKCNLILDRLRNNPAIHELCNSYNISFENNQREFNFCIKTFVKYLSD